MKTYVTLCLMTILLSTMNAFAQAPSKTRRSTPQPNISRPTDFGKFIGVWEFNPDYSMTKGYFKVTEEQPRRFKFMEGFEYQGRITWAETMVNHADGIYLKPLNGKLAGRFTSPNFRATHGHDITYRITLALESNGKLLYSVSGLEPGSYHATKVNNGEDVGEVITSSSKVTVASAFLSQLDKAKARALTLRKLTVVDGYALQDWSTEHMGGQALLMFSPSSGTWVLMSMGGGAWDADSLVSVGVPRAIAALLVKRSLEPPPPRHPRRRRT